MSIILEVHEELYSYSDNSSHTFFAASNHLMSYFTHKLSVKEGSIKVGLFRFINQLLNHQTFFLSKIIHPLAKPQVPLLLLEKKCSKIAIVLTKFFVLMQ